MCSRNASDRARISTWRLDVTRRDAPEGIEWAITDQDDSVRSTISTGCRSTPPGNSRRRPDAAGRGLRADIGRGRGVRGRNRSGHHGDRDDRPRADDFSIRRRKQRKRQVRIFSGADGSNARFDAAYLRLNPADFDRLISTEQLRPAPVDPAEFRKAETDLPRGLGQVVRPGARRSVTRNLVARAPSRRFRRRDPYPATSTP